MKKIDIILLIEAVVLALLAGDMQQNGTLMTVFLLAAIIYVIVLFTQFSKSKIILASVFFAWIGIVLAIFDVCTESKWCYTAILILPLLAPISLIAGFIALTRKDSLQKENSNFPTNPPVSLQKKILWGLGIAVGCYLIIVLFNFLTSL